MTPSPFSLGRQSYLDICEVDMMMHVRPGAYVSIGACVACVRLFRSGISGILTEDTAAVVHMGVSLAKWEYTQ